MIVVSILYPQTEDSSFDMDYYTSSHMPMFAASFGGACTGWGAATIGNGTWAAIGWATVESQEAFDATMAEHGRTIMSDIPNYTSVRPELLVGEYAGGS